MADLNDFDQIGNEIHQRNTANTNNAFTDDFSALVGKVRPDLKLNYDERQKLRSDPEMARQMTIEYAKQNAAWLASMGVPVNSTTLSLSHTFGPISVKRMLANPQQSVEDALSSQPSLWDHIEGAQDPDPRAWRYLQGNPTYQGYGSVADMMKGVAPPPAVPMPSNSLGSSPP